MVEGVIVTAGVLNVFPLVPVGLVYISIEHVPWNKTRFRNSVTFTHFVLPLDSGARAAPINGAAQKQRSSLIAPAALGRVQPKQAIHMKLKRTLFLDATHRPYVSHEVCFFCFCSLPWSQDRLRQYFGRGKKLDICII